MLAGIVDNMPGLLAYVDSGLCYRFANATYKSWRGIDPDLIVGRSFREVVGEQSYPYLIAKAQQALNGEAVTYEHELFDGPRRRYVHGSYTPDRRDDGSIAGFIILVSDISERYKLEQQLRRSERQFNDAFHASAIGMALVDPDGRWREVNAALTGMLGYSSEELSRLTFQTITHPDDLHSDLSLLDQLIAGERASYQLEKRYLRKDGAIVHAILSVSIVRDDSGRTVQFVAQIQDITDRRQAEERLFQEHELSQVTLRSIGDGVITSDVGARVTWMNPVAERLTGWTSDDALGQPIDAIFRVVDERGRPVADPLARAIAAETVVELEKDAVLISRSGAQVPVADSAAPIHNRAGQVVGGVLVFQDVSDERRLQHELRTRAETDPLTGLLNRAGFNRELDRALARATRKNGQIALLFCDLDGFKRVNDRHGHAQGDWVLQEVARRLTDTIRVGDVLGRWAGDEFSIIVGDAGRTSIDQVTDRLIAAVAAPLHAPGLAEPLSVGLSIGVAYTTSDIDAAHLLLQADKRLYAAKAAGGRSAVTTDRVKS
jgi:diguanylate cyclase (GGDEF)-like protein/PAS domain S-box-containing protein